jgi:DNA-binding PucR family transcriptional regulator
MARELHIHPQTARYRMSRLRELLGSELDDPDARFELEAALRGRGLSGAGSAAGS